MLKASRNPKLAVDHFADFPTARSCCLSRVRCNRDRPRRKRLNIFARLQSLREILDHQEVDLLDWPDSPGKDRFYASLLNAKRLVAQIADDLAGAAAADAAKRGAESA